VGLPYRTSELKILELHVWLKILGRNLPLSYGLYQLQS